MITLSRLNAFLFLIMFLVFAFISKLMSWIGLHINGIEYLCWFVLISLVVLINLKKVILLKSYLILLVLTAGMCVLNFFFVDVPVIRYLQGAFFTFLFAVNFIVFYNIKVEEHDFYFIVRALIFILTLVAVVAYLERIFISGTYQSYFLRGVGTIAKDPGFAASLLNINLILCLLMYFIGGRRRYIFLAAFSVVTIIMLLFLKSVAASIIICLVFIAVYLRSAVKRYGFFLLIGSVFFLFVMILGQPILKEINYKASLYFGSDAEKTPRNALYVASYQIAKDYFPFGSGQGTFGSYPVGKSYSDIYYQYNLDKVHGLGLDDALGKTDSHFIFDTYWSSIIGELGFIAGSLYILLWLLPAIKSFRFLRSKNPRIRVLAFFVTVTTFIIFFESIALPLPGQLQFIMIYAGMGAIAYTLILHHRHAPSKN